MDDTLNCDQLKRFGVELKRNRDRTGVQVANSCLNMARVEEETPDYII